MSRVGVASHQPAEAKVCHFDQVVLADQAVTGCQVPADAAEDKYKKSEKANLTQEGQVDATALF